MKLETVKIVSKENDTGFVIINKSDMKDCDVIFGKAKDESEEMSEEERQLRDEYELLYGKKAGGRMKLETLREAVEAKKD